MKSERFHPKVNEVNEFLETASDFEDPLEVIRESLSNSYDAMASNVSITIRNQGGQSDIIIEDDGHGMARQDLEAFFDLGNSNKTDAIGYKGHGTKIFYKSDRIVVSTARDGVNLRATMDEPWAKLNDRILPEYEVTETGTRSGNDGTLIKISGFRAGQGFEPEALTYNKIHHYLKWKTIAGSTAHFFEDNPRKMTITIELGDEIDDTREKLVTSNHLEFPPEQLEAKEGQFPGDSMCKHYPPREIDIDTETGGSKIQIVGMIGGKSARNQLPTYGKHSAQFGVWLAKDYIKVERLNETIASDNEFLHFFFIANCQDIELSANREKIRNKTSPVFEAIKDEINHYMSKVSADPWFKDYLETRRAAKVQRRASKQRSTLQERYEKISERNDFEPANRAEVVLGLERLNRNGNGPNITVEDFDLESEINAIIQQNDELFGTAVHMRLTDHFDRNKPLQSIDKIICWDFGDIDKLQQYEREKYHKGDVEIDFEEEMIYYHNGERFQVDVVPIGRWYDSNNVRGLDRTDSIQSG